MEDTVAALLQPTGGGAAVAVGGVAIVAGLERGIVDHTIAAAFGHTGRRAAVAIAEIGVVAAFADFDGAVAADLFRGAGGGAAVATGGVAVVAFLAVVEGAVAAGLGGDEDESGPVDIVAAAEVRLPTKGVGGLDHRPAMVLPGGFDEVDDVGGDVKSHVARLAIGDRHRDAHITPGIGGGLHAPEVGGVAVVGPIAGIGVGSARIGGLVFGKRLAQGLGHEGLTVGGEPIGGIAQEELQMGGDELLPVEGVFDGGGVKGDQSLAPIAGAHPQQAFAAVVVVGRIAPDVGVRRRFQDRRCLKPLVGHAGHPKLDAGHPRCLRTPGHHGGDQKERRRRQHRGRQAT